MLGHLGMSFRTIPLCSVVIGMAILGAAAQDQVAVSPTRIVIECEEMAGVAQDRFGPGPGWQVGRWGHELYQNMVFGGTWASRLRTAMTDAGDNPAEIASEFAIPRDGTYKIWVKYECPPFFNYAFRVRVERRDAGGGIAFDKIYGLRQAAKHFSFKDKLISGDLYWNWGIDHDAAEGYPAELKAGKYRLVISKAANPAPAGWRSLDAVLITSDLSELSAPSYPRFPLLEELKAENHVYFRFRNPANGSGPIVIDWNHMNHRPKYYYGPSAEERNRVRFYDDNGKELSGGKGGVWPDAIPVGGVSPWHDLGPTMVTESTSPFTVKGLRPGGKPRQDPSQPIEVDIALAPRADAIVRSFSLAPGEEALNFLVQPDLFRPEGVAYTKKESDIYAELISELNKEPRLGPIPKRLRFWSSFGGFSRFEDKMGFRQALGLNTLTTLNDIPRELEWAKNRGGLVQRSYSYHHSQDPEKIIELVRKNHAEDHFYNLSFGDEIALPPVDVKDAAMVAAFQDYVRSEGETPKSLGVKSWSEVKPLPSLAAEVAVQIGVVPEAKSEQAADVGPLKRLFWYSTLFRKARGIALFEEKTRRLREGLGPEVHTTANLGSMMPFYWMDQGSFIDAFKGGAMTLGWSEDYTYCQPEASRLIIDFEVAYLRKGASYRDTPMQFYCMAHWPGNNPQQLLQNVVLAWGQNVKDIDYFSAMPDIWNTENYVAYRGGLPTFRMVRTISGMAGLVEDHLLPARTKTARVAMLISEASDLWETEGKGQRTIEPGSTASNVSQEERKNLWYALRYAGHRVDLVTESDCVDGLLKNYSVLYVCGQNLHRKAAAAVRQWVAEGGTLFATAGAARKDQFDEPLTGLDGVLGRGKSVDYRRYRGPLRARLELLFEQPLDQLRFSDGSQMPVYCSREEFEVAPEATTLARYGNGRPALIKHRFGRGWAYATGTLPGQTWAKAALPVLPQGKGGPNTLPWMQEFLAHHPVAEAMILTPLRDAALEPDVRASHRGVITNTLQSNRSTVLAVVNLALEAQGELRDVRISVANLPRVTRAWSCFHRKASLLKEFDQGTATILLPKLGPADVVVLEHGQ